MKVRDVMTIKDALELMRREQVRRLPVVNPDGVLQGILSLNDVVSHSESGGGKSTEDVQRFLTLVEQIKGSYTLPPPSEERPPAFDEKGHSPVERIFNEQGKD